MEMDGMVVAGAIMGCGGNESESDREQPPGLQDETRRDVSCGVCVRALVSNFATPRIHRWDGSICTANSTLARPSVRFAALPHVQCTGAYL